MNIDREYDVRKDSFDLTLYQGADESLSLQLLDDDENPSDLTGYSAQMDIRTRPGGDLLLRLATSGSGITISPSTGTISVVISKEQTDALPGSACYDIATVSSSGSVTYHLRGALNVTRKVTDV